MTSPVRVRRMRRSHWVLVGVLLVLAGLSAWGVRARVPVYAVAAHTPLALDPALQVVVTPVAGQVRVTTSRSAGRSRPGRYWWNSTARPSACSSKRRSSTSGP